MQSYPVSVYQIDVTFDAETKQLSFMGDIEDRKIRVPQGIHLIHFMLRTTSFGPELKATFPSYPIQWLGDDGGPIVQPQCFMGQWCAPHECHLVDFNTARSYVEHKFNVVVIYEGKTYGSDPTIINEPPSGGG